MGILSWLSGKKTAELPAAEPQEPAEEEQLPVAQLAAELAEIAPERRIDAARALLERWRAGDAEAASALAPHVHELLADPEPSMRLVALAAVHLFRKPENIDRCASGVLAALNDGVAQVRTAAVWAAAALPTEAARVQLHAALESREEPLRFAAACALANRQDAAAVPELLRAVHEGVRRQEAVAALITLGDPSCVPDLVQLFEGEDEAALEPFDKTSVAAALAKFGDARGAAWLVERIENDGDDGPIAVDWAARLGVQDAVPALLELAENEGSHARGAAVRALGTLRAPGAEERLRGILDDEEEPPELRMDAAEGLADLGTPSAIAALKAHSGGGDELAEVCAELVVQLAAQEAARAAAAELPK
jgi:HEAT repeat protein